MNSHIYPLFVGCIFLLGMGGVFLSCRKLKQEVRRAGEYGKGNSKSSHMTLILTFFFCLAFALTFESYGALSSSFALCLTLGVIWSGRYRAGNFAAELAVSFICTGGIWLVFDRIFSMSLP